LDELIDNFCNYYCSLSRFHRSSDCTYVRLDNDNTLHCCYSRNNRSNNGNSCHLHPSHSSNAHIGTLFWHCLHNSIDCTYVHLDTYNTLHYCCNYNNRNYTSRFWMMSHSRRCFEHIYKHCCPNNNIDSACDYWRTYNTLAFRYHNNHTYTYSALSPNHSFRGHKHIDNDNSLSNHRNQSRRSSCLLRYCLDIYRTHHLHANRFLRNNPMNNCSDRACRSNFRLRSTNYQDSMSKPYK